jgi:hypothetical protein
VIPFTDFQVKVKYLPSSLDSHPSGPSQAHFPPRKVGRFSSVIFISRVGVGSLPKIVIFEAVTSSSHVFIIALNALNIKRKHHLRQKGNTVPSYRKELRDIYDVHVISTKVLDEDSKS